MGKFKFGNGSSLDDKKIALACDRFDATLSFHAAEIGSLPYLVGENNPVSDTTAGLVSAIAIVAMVSIATGGVPVTETMIYGDCKKGVLGVDISDEPPVNGFEIGDIEKYARSRDVLLSAQKMGATHVTSVGMQMLGLDSEDGSLTSGPSVSVVLKFVTWDIKRGAGIRWYAKVSHSGDDDRPLHVIPWDVKEDGSRYDWRSVFESVDMSEPIEESEVGAYFMKILRPGVEVVTDVDSEESVIPTERYAGRGGALGMGGSPVEA